MDARDSGLRISAIQLNHKVNQPLCLEAEQAQERQLLLSWDVSESQSWACRGWRCCRGARSQKWMIGGDEMPHVCNQRLSQRTFKGVWLHRVTIVIVRRWTNHSELCQGLKLSQWRWLWQDYWRLNEVCWGERDRTHSWSLQIVAAVPWCTAGLKTLNFQERELWKKRRNRHQLVSFTTSWSQKRFIQHVTPYDVPVPSPAVLLKNKMLPSGPNRRCIKLVRCTDKPACERGQSRLRDWACPSQIIYAIKVDFSQLRQRAFVSTLAQLQGVSTWKSPSEPAVSGHGQKDFSAFSCYFLK